MGAPALTAYVQGVSVLSADGLNTFQQTCDSYAQLRAFVGSQSIQVFARGYTSPGDGGQGNYYWQANAAGPDDNFNVIVPSAGGGAWVRIPGYQGTITGVTAGPGLSGGGTSGAVTLSISEIAAGDVLANLADVAAAPEGHTVTSVLDVITSTVGAIMWRGEAGWSYIGSGTAGRVLTATGSATAPIWSTAAEGTITGIFGVSGLDGGGTSGEVTMGLEAIPNLEILANISGFGATPSPNTLASILDASFGSTQGSILFRGSPSGAGGSWGGLPLGTAGDVLVATATSPAWASPASIGAVTSVTGSGAVATSPTTGAVGVTLATTANNEILANISGGVAAPSPHTMTAILDSTMGTTRGDIIYRGASNWAALGLGTTGQMVRSNGTDLTWASALGYAGDQSFQTAGWATGNNFTSNCSFYTSATTQQASEREILSGVYFVNSLGGNQSASPQRDKVAFSSQIETSGTNSGDQWAVYPVAVINSGAFSSQGTTTYGLEVDINNNSGVSLANFPTIGGHVAQAYGIALTGASGNLCTAALWVTGVSAQWDKGIWFTGSSVIGTAAFRDETNSPTSVQILGSHTYGIDMSGATFSNGPINFPVGKTATSATTGTASALPALPQTYIIIYVNGNALKVPAYNT